MTPSPEPDDAGSEEQHGESAEDAAWRAIIDNYGDRPLIDDAAPDPEPQQPPRASWPTPRPPSEDEPVEDDLPEGPVPDALQDHYVPPPPPPLPKPPPARLLAWTGLFGVPLLVLVALVAGLSLPSWLGLILMVWFVGGFVFLVASMRPGPGDHDDGARL